MTSAKRVRAEEQPDTEATEVDADATPEEAPVEPPDVGNWQPLIVEPPAEVAPDADTPEPAKPVLPAGSVVVIYRGFADLAGPIEIDGVTYSFRPGEPVVMPSAAAEQVLTWPHEPFDWLDSTED